MAIPSHIRYGANALLGIALLTGLGYWFMQSWPSEAIETALVGDGVEQSGAVSRETGAYFEGARRGRIHGLLVDAKALDSRRNIELSIQMPLASLLRPGEEMPPVYLRELFAEARVAEHLKARCAEWQDMIADRCAMTMVKLEQATETRDGAWLNVVAQYAITPKSVDSVEGDVNKMRFDQLRVTFDMKAPDIDVAERPAYMARAFETYEQICAERRAEYGNCNFFWFKFRERPNASGTKMNLTGNANIGWLLPSGARS